MTRRDAYLDAMLRHLGAAYYESLHGRASVADVERALDSVEDHTNEHARVRGEGGPAAGTPAAGAGAAGSPATGAAAAGERRPGPPRRSEPQHHGRWHHRVRDVMTADVVTVDRITPFKEIATLMAEHGVSAVPVLTMGRHVAGIVSEGDLIAVQDKREREAQQHPGGRLHFRNVDRKHWGRTAEELMTSPAITIHPDATLPAAARLMNSHHLKRVPVVDPDGILLGIVSRRDLLSVFLRPDEAIAREVREMLSQVLLADPDLVTAKVHNGVVTLTGHAGPGEQADLIAVAVRLSWDIDGVVDVQDRVEVTAGS
jgi:CBS domain-containing protein